jgi:Gpi18-like mannosyltransferase
MNRGTAWSYAFLFFAIHKLIAVGSSLLFVYLYIPYSSRLAYLEYSLIQNFIRWDAEWYIQIAFKGYFNEQASAFFPLYPYMIRGFHELFGLSYRASGLLISNVAFFLALYMLIRLLSIDFSKPLLLRTLTLLVLFPTSFYFSAVYTESLFLFWIAGSFYFVRNRNWWWAGIFGFFASLTRNTGVLLLLPFLYEYLAERDFDRRRIQGDIFPIVLIPAGVFAYMLLLVNKTGDPLGFVHAQRYWGRGFTWPWVTMWQGLLDLFFKHRPGLWSRINHSFDTFVGYWELVLTALAAVKQEWQIRRSYWLYAAAAVIVPLLSPNIPNSYFYSVPRFVIVVFPVFLIWALMLRQKRWLVPVAAISLAGQVYLMYMFTKGAFVY